MITSTRLKLAFAAAFLLALAVPTLSHAEPAAGSAVAEANGDVEGAVHEDVNEDINEDDVACDDADEDECDAKVEAACDATIAPDVTRGLGATLLTVGVASVAFRRRRT